MVGTGVLCAIRSQLVTVRRSSIPAAGILERIGMILQGNSGKAKRLRI
jgi:hypothetical protein